MATLSSSAAISLFLDNLQWADEGTLSLVAHLVTEITEWIYPVAFVATYRRPAVVATDDHPLAGTIDRLEQCDALTDVRLDPLSRSETDTLVTAMLGDHQFPDAFGDLLYEWTGGLPLSVRETVTHLLETDVIVPTESRYPSDKTAVQMPDAVAERIERRLSQLDDESRELLALGAVVGEFVPRTMLATASDLSTPVRHEYEDLFVASGLWERVDDAGFRFVSGGVRDAVADRLTDDQARQYHERVANAIVDVADDERERAGRIAHHFERAGVDDAALEYYRLAGKWAADSYATGDAITNFERALTIATDLNGIEPESVAAPGLRETAGTPRSKRSSRSALHTTRCGRSTTSSSRSASAMPGRCRSGVGALANSWPTHPRAPPVGTATGSTTTVPTGDVRATDPWRPPSNLTKRVS